MNANSIFKDKGLESEFEENGYLRVPFLNEEEIRCLKSKYQEFGPIQFPATQVDTLLPLSSMMKSIGGE
jgi:hypothetical protein